MTITLSKKALAGTRFEGEWDELKNIYYNSTVENQIRAIVLDYFRHKPLKGKETKAGRRINIDRIYYGLAYKIKKGGIEDIAHVTGKTHANALNGVSKFENYYKLYKEFRFDVQSIVLNLPLQYQKIAFESLKELV